jgi:hypothetical protein
MLRDLTTDPLKIRKTMWLLQIYGAGGGRDSNPHGARAPEDFKGCALMIPYANLLSAAFITKFELYPP